MLRCPIVQYIAISTSRTPSLTFVIYFTVYFLRFTRRPPTFYTGAGFLQRSWRPEILKETLDSDKSTEPLWSLQILFAFYSRGRTSAKLFETLSAQRSSVILTRLAPLACASKILEKPEEASSFEDRRKLRNSRRTHTILLSNSSNHHGSHQQQAPHASTSRALRWNLRQETEERAITTYWGSVRTLTFRSK